MKKLSDAELNRLLAGRNQLTQADKDAVLEAVLAKLPPEPGEQPKPLFASWMRWAAVAALVLIAVPVGYLSSRPRQGSFAARGELTAARPTFSVFCAADLAEGRCARGGKILFRVDAEGERHFAALARSDAGAVVWYFEALEVGALPAGGLLDQGVPLGPEHAPGRWEVFGLFSQRPLNKSEIRALLESEGAREHPAVEIVRRPLEVLP